MAPGLAQRGGQSGSVRDNRSMQFGILGPTRVEREPGQPLPVGGSRLRALLARLLLSPGQVVGAGRLIADLYGAEPPAGAGNALQSQVSRLRRLLPAPAGIDFDPAGYRLAVEPGRVDAHRFERSAAQGRRALAAGEPAQARLLLRQALDQWRGPALADVRDAPFAPSTVARLEEQWLAAVIDRIEAELALGDAAPVVPELRQLVAAHPLREQLSGQLMRALAASGRQAEALAVYEQARRTLAEELGADPSPELAGWHRAVLRGEAASGTVPAGIPAQSPASGPGRAAPAAPAESDAALAESAPAALAESDAAPVAGSGRALPTPVSSFVGREDELARLGKLLTEARLVTVTGPGGAGKTRLAVEAARRDGAETCLVELAPLPADADLPRAVLTALGLRDAGLRATPGRTDPVGRLTAALRDRPLLLLLDNCEHVVGAAARLAGQLLASCSQLRVLATSRESLGVSGEALYPLSGLPLPPADAPPVAVREYAAVRLFLERAAEVAAAPGPDELDQVRTICRTLDGLPLAIELAAARLRSLSAAEVADRLRDRFRLLNRGQRTAEPRHQTLRAVVGWSWDLLDPAEQALARQLTVFAGGASAEAVERVTGLPAHDVVDLLANLVDKSLVESSRGRYRMLETVRAYGAERLAEAGEADRLRRAHAAFYLDFARTADPYLRRREQLRWLSRLDAERDNLHAALRRSVAAGDLPTALGLVSSLSMYWWLRGRRGEAAVLAAGLLAVVGDEPPPGWEEEYALCVLTSGLAAKSGPQRPASAWAQQTLTQRLKLNSPPRQPFVLFLSALADGPPPDGAAGVEALLEHNGHLLDDPWCRALQPIGVGMLRMYAGELDRAEQDIRTSLAEFRELGERWGTMTALANLAELYDWRGDHAAAVTVMGEALLLADQLGSTVDMAEQLRVRGAGRLRAGDLSGSEADFDRALDLARQAGAPEIVAAAYAGHGAVALRRGDPAAARQWCETALAECPSGWFAADGTRSGILAALGSIAEAEGRVDLARQSFQAALTAPVPELGEAVAGLARLAVVAGAEERAARFLGAGAALRQPGSVTAVPDTAPLVEQLRARLGDERYQRAFTQAAALAPDQARAVLLTDPSADGA